jgi:hypothetical protein
VTVAVPLAEVSAWLVAEIVTDVEDGRSVGAV